MQSGDFYILIKRTVKPNFFDEAAITCMRIDIENRVHFGLRCQKVSWDPEPMGPRSCMGDIGLKKYGQG